MHATIEGYTHNGPDNGEDGKVYVSANLPAALYDEITGYSGPALVTIYDTLVVVNVGNLHFLLDRKPEAVA